MSDPDFARVKEVFDERTMYDAVVQAGYMHHGELAATLADWARTCATPLQVVDLGCGDAWLAVHAFGDANVERYFGVDVSESSVERAGRRLASWQGRARVVAGDMARVLHALPDESANVVLASYSIHHVASAGKQSILSDCRRIMARGGTFFWIDVVRREEETRGECIARLTGAIQRDWIRISHDHRDQACAHIRESDYPETIEWMRGHAQQAGLDFAGTLLHDEFFAALAFARPST